MTPPPFCRALRLPRAAGHRVHRAGPGRVRAGHPCRRCRAAPAGIRVTSGRRPRSTALARMLSSARKEAASMRIYTDINLADQTISMRELHGEAAAKAARHPIARKPLYLEPATVDPPRPANSL